jgi:hypothetical protein
MTRFNTKMTSAEAAAFKAKNLAQRPTVVVITPTRKPARKSQRQEFTELLAETRDMIRAAKREGHFHILPALLQRAATFQAVLGNRAIV